MIDFSKIRFDDAEILRVFAVDCHLHVIYRDWKEIEHTLVFEYVAGYQWFSPEGKPLSHSEVSDNDPFISLACRMADEDREEDFKVFSFVSAWTDAKILRIVAKGLA